jgi:hypothetical protein
MTHTYLGRDAEADKAAKGIRYYGTSPYLLAYSDGKGGIIVSEVLSLPDPDKKMSAEAVSTLAEVGGTLEFDRGVLTTSSETGDATVVPNAVLKAVETLAPSILAKMFDDPTKKKDFEIPGPYLFKIVLKGGAPYLVGGAADTPIKITLLPQEKKEK